MLWRPRVLRQKTREDWIARVADMPNLLAAWRAVRRNKGQEGTDGVTVQAFQAELGIHLQKIQRALGTQTYQPCALKRIALPKPDQQQRFIGIPTVADRVVQHAILNVLEPHFEPTFFPCSYGFRPGRSAHHAVQAVASGLAQGLWWVVEADLEDFFDTLDWAILCQALERVIPDPHLIGLIRHFLQAGVLRKPNATAVAQGTPQGAVFSPLFANIYLTPFDRQMLTRGCRLIRYGDDFRTLHRTKDEATAALRFMQQLLEGELKLRLHRDKTHITHAQHQPFDFLSFRFSRSSFMPAPHAVERFKAQARATIEAQRAQGIHAIATQLNPLIRGWGEYFKIGQVAELYRQLDAWIAFQLGGPPNPANGVVSLVSLSMHHRNLLPS